MSKISKIVIVMVVLALAVIVIAKGLSKEDDWICAKRGWVKHGNPSSPMPTTPCVAVGMLADVKIVTPNLEEPQSSPLIIYGSMKRGWFFEAVAGAKVLDKSGKVIGEGQLHALGNWMENEWADFNGEISFVTKDTEGTLVILSDNPSGLPENQKEQRFPIKFLPVETMAVKVFFPSTINDPNVMQADKVYAVTRQVPKTTGVARAALTELFKGLTAEEKARGYYTGLRSGIIINKLEIKEGVAYLDLGVTGDGEIYLPGTVATAAFVPQIENTLKQFAAIKSVVITQDGKQIEVNP